MKNISAVRCFELPVSSFCLINFADIVKQNRVRIIDELHMFGLLDNGLNVRSADTKRVFYHHIIKSMCDCILNRESSSKAVIFFNVYDLDVDWFQEMIDNDKMRSFIKCIIDRVRLLIPTFVYKTDISFAEFERSRARYNLQDELMLINQRLLDHSVSSFNFSRIKKFSKQYNLNYLSEVYFNSIKAKSLMFV